MRVVRLRCFSLDLGLPGNIANSVLFRTADSCAQVLFIA